jgi:regulator of replication initiation timing
MKEEKKLTDDTEINVGMIENALKCLAGQKACDLCAYDDLAMQDGERTCIDLAAEDTLDLIRRLQSEVQRLAKVEMEFIGKIADQKAEIERLKKRHGVALLRNDDLDLENYELKKQLETMKADITTAIENYKKEMPKAMEECEKKIEEIQQQAVKDTAKEILKMLYTAMPKTNIVVEIKKRYGVEVE